jgi:hypothetical protein
MVASSAELIEAVREQGFKGIVAEAADSVYKHGSARLLGRRCAGHGGAIS